MSVVVNTRDIGLASLETLGASRILWKLYALLGFSGIVR
jgi:hypothetical protein